MMKGGKEEEMAAGPLFPRLHVNDADKWGPRAPPRNKMALYEQLSIPSQRFNPSAASTLPIPPYNNASTSFPSVSSSQGGSHGRSVFSPFYVPPQSPAHSTDMVQSHSLDSRSLNSKGIEFGRSARFADYKSSKAARSVAECSTIRPRDLSIGKASSSKDNEDDFRVPTFAFHETANSNKATHVVEKTRLTPLCANDPEGSYSIALNSNQFPSSYDKPLEQCNANTKSRKHESEQVTRGTAVFEDHVETSVSHQETGEKLAKASKFSKASSHQKDICAKMIIGETFHGSTEMSPKPCDNEARDQPECSNDTEFGVTQDALRVESKPYSKGPSGNYHKGPNLTYNCRGGNDDKSSGSMEPKDLDKNDEVSEASMLDTISGLEISPDDVVGIIGPKQFWKARRAIVNQQRVFAAQVFELHRLIKVQKLIAASPDLLLEDNPYLTGPPQKMPDKNLPPGSSTQSQSQPQIVKQKNNSQNLNQYAECQTEDTQTPIPSHDDVPNKGLHQLPRYGPYSGNLPQLSVAPENEPSSWFCPPANHWLVPVMSPSEGLIYKPYTGLCPLPAGAGFMAPVYGSCGPLNIPPVAGDFMNAAYGVSATHQQQNMGVFPGAPAIAPNYFATPYHPPANPNISDSAVEQVSPMTGPRPTGQIEQHSRSSCNMTNLGGEIPWKLGTSKGTSKGSEPQGSTASSPCERAQWEGRDALPLFPVAPPREGAVQPSLSHDGDHQARVIKVVPHNARSATESAARIFRSIQKEREKY